MITLTGISKGTKVAPGDTIISSGLSTSSIPKGMMLGIVKEVKTEKSSNKYLIRFRTSANFNNLEYVYAIDNKQALEIQTILDKSKQKNQ